jgi:hypothetical protein
MSTSLFGNAQVMGNAAHPRGSPIKGEYESGHVRHAQGLDLGRAQGVAAFG